ncbi:MAG: glycosyl transferase family protein [Bacteroidetes bacterium]|nr:MAG: glycosyl transferase family protein [Bacteroidota bacterium]
MDKLVSIVIPAYNAASYLAETIETVLRQTYPHWELIIVDDGSTDKTAEVTSGFLQDKRIRYEKQQNAGVSAARNYGASFAKGEYLAFLDADDLWHTEYLGKKISFLEKNKQFGMVVGNIRVIDPQSKPQFVFYMGISADAVKSTVEFRDQYSAHPSNIFCRRDDYLKTNGFTPELSNSADKMFYIDFARFSPIGSIDEILVFYRVHPQNMHRNLDLMISDFRVFLQLLKARNVFSGKEQEKLCAVKIYRICAGGSLQQRNFLNFFRYLAIASWVYPGFMLRDIFSRDRFRGVLFSALHKMRIGNIMLKRNRKKGRIPILLFHRITPEFDYLYPPLPPDFFYRLLQFLSKYYRFISLDDLLHRPADENRDAACIVFDDGFSDFRHFALPVLQELNVPTTLFLPAANIRNQEVIWTSQLDNAISNTQLQELTIQIGGPESTFDLRTSPARLLSARKIRMLLLRLPNEEFETSFARVKEMLGYRVNLDTTLLTVEQLQQVKSMVKIQSHTLTHRYLPSLSEAEIERELSESQKQLQDTFGEQVTCLSYPIGGYNEATKKLASKYYTASFAVNNRGVELGRLQDTGYRQELPRFNVHNKNLYEVFFRINGFHRLFGR